MSTGFALILQGSSNFEYRSHRRYKGDAKGRYSSREDVGTSNTGQFGESREQVRKAASPRNFDTEQHRAKYPRPRRASISLSLSLCILHTSFFSLEDFQTASKGVPGRTRKRQKLVRHFDRKHKEKYPYVGPYSNPRRGASILVEQSESFAFQPP